MVGCKIFNKLPWPRYKLEWRLASEVNFPSNIFNRSYLPQSILILNVHVCLRGATGRLGKRLANKRGSNRYLSTKSSGPLIFNRIGDIVELQFVGSRSSLCGAQPAQLAFQSSSRLKLNSRVYSNVNLFLRHCLNLHCVFLVLGLFLYIRAQVRRVCEAIPSYRLVIHSFVRCFCYFSRLISTLFRMCWTQAQMARGSCLGV